MARLAGSKGGCSWPKHAAPQPSDPEHGPTFRGIRHGTAAGLHHRPVGGTVGTIATFAPETKPLPTSAPILCDGDGRRDDGSYGSVGRGSISDKE